MKYFVLLFIIGLFFQSTAQKEIKYVSPPKVVLEDCEIKIDNVVSEEEFCKFKLQIENKSADYVTIDLSKIGFIYEGYGTYYPPKGKLKIVEPKSSKSAVIKLAGNGLNYLAPKFNVDIEGLGKGSKNSEISIDKLTIKEGESTIIDDVKIEVSKVKIKNGNVSVSIETNYMGENSDFAVIDLTKLSIFSGEKKINKISNNGKDKILLKGKTTRCNISFESQETQFEIKNSTIGANYSINSQKVEAITIKKPGYSETVTSSTTVVSANKGGCGSYSADNFSTKPVKLMIFSEEGTCFQVQAFGVNINPDFSSNVSFGFDISGKVNLLMQDGSKLEKKIVLNSEILAASYKLKKNKKEEFVLKLVPGSVVYKENSTTNSNNGENEKRNKGITISTSSSSTKTVNGKVIESESSSSEINIGD